ncbi:MAG TPA: hypothetical protein VF816_09910 [Rhodocyclaceae bacterium]
MTSALRCAVFSLLMALVPACVQAASDRATDDAFAALLTLSAPEQDTAQWDIPVPEDFDGQSETALIAYLAKKKRAGADFNAYRHFGTLLHHAIRAGKLKTAAWLLENGADPRKTLKGSNEDALALSLRFKRNALARQLQERYGLEPPAAAPSKAAPQAQGETLPAGISSEADIAAARMFLLQTSWATTSPGLTPAATKAAQDRLAKWKAFAARQPAQAMAQVLDDDVAIGALVRVHARSPRDLDKALAALPPELLKRRGAAAAAMLASLARVDIADKNPKREYWVPADSWRVLWRHVGRPVAYGESHGLAGRVQPELWPELFASGYADRDARSALGCLVNQIGAKDLQSIWPSLEAQFPDLRDVAARMVLDHVRMAGAEFCWSWNDDETAQKLSFLISRGVTGPVKGIVERDLQYRSAAFLTAMKPFRAESRPTAKPRLVEVGHKCRFTPSDAWYHELLTNATTVEGLAIETVQLIELPGEAECALLVGGFFSLSSEPTDSFTGPEDNPVPSCPDPAGGYQVLREERGHIVRFDTDMTRATGGTVLTRVRDAASGRYYYLRDGGGLGRCESRLRLPMAFEWAAAQRGPALKAVTGHAIEDVLFDQCRAVENGVYCDGIASLQFEQDAAATPPPADGFSGMDYRPFLKTYWAVRYDEYQAAILALDKPRLKTLQQGGIPGDWTADAIRRVGASTLPLAEKRKRIAWIFYDRRQLARALDSDMTEGLLDWLPREDWGPLLAVLSEQGINVRRLRQLAEEKGLSRLACDLDHAQGLICGENWGRR